MFRVLITCRRGFDHSGILLTLGLITNNMHSYDTVTAAVNGLKSRGFTLDFSLAGNCLVCGPGRFDIDDFEIVEVYRFEGDSDPADEAVVYGVDGTGNRKGILVTGYGISSEGLSTEMVKKLSIHKENE